MAYLCFYLFLFFLSKLITEGIENTNKTSVIAEEIEEVTEKIEVKTENTEKLEAVIPIPITSNIKAGPKFGIKKVCHLYVQNICKFEKVC